MPGNHQNPAKTLVEKIWGSDFIQSLPAKWRATLKYRNEKTPGVPNNTDPDEIGINDVINSQVVTGRTNELEKTTTKLDAELTSSLVDVDTNQQGQVVTVTETLQDATIVPPVPTATKTVQKENVGGGLAVQKVSEVPSVFSAAEYSTEIPDPIPEEFRVVAPVSTSTITSAGTVDTTPDLGVGDLERKESQVTAFLKRIYIKTRSAVGLPASLVGKDTNREKQVVTVTQTLRVAGSDPVPTALKDVKVQNLGNGTVLETKQEVASVFAGKSRGVGVPEAIPTRFRATDATTTAEDIVAGSVSSVSLGAGEVERQEQDVTEFTKRVRTTSFDPGAAPTLNGQDYERQYDVTIPFTERLTVAGANLGQPRTEISPLSSTVDLVKEFDVSAVGVVLDEYLVEFTGTTNINLPDVLESVAVIVDKNEGTGESISSTASFVFNTSARASSQGSASLTAEVLPQIRETSKRNISTRRKVFFLPLPVTEEDVLDKLGDVEPWPDFQPVGHSIAVIGKHASVAVNVETGIHINLGIEITSGHGHSQDVGPNSRATFIRPTIHDDIDLEFLYGAEDEEATASATASVTNPVVYYPYQVPSLTETLEVPIQLRVFPTSLPATNVTEIPTGTFLLNIDASIFGYGYALIHTETVNL